MCHYPVESFPHSSVSKESTCNAGDPGSIPGSERSPGEGIGYPLQYSGLENPMDCIVFAVAKSRIQLSDFHFHLPCRPNAVHNHTLSYLVFSPSLFLSLSPTPSLSTIWNIFTISVILCLQTGVLIGLTSYFIYLAENYFISSLCIFLICL